MKILGPIAYARLESLDLQYSPNFIHLQTYNQMDVTNLQSLPIWHWDQIDEWRIKDLRILKVRMMAISSWEPLRSILSASPNLEELSLRWKDEEGMVPPSQELAEFPKLNVLRSLSLEDTSDDLVFLPLLSALITRTCKILV